MNISPCRVPPPIPMGLEAFGSILDEAQAAAAATTAAAKAADEE